MLLLMNFSWQNRYLLLDISFASGGFALEPTTIWPGYFGSPQTNCWASGVRHWQWQISRTVYCENVHTSRNYLRKFYTELHTSFFYLHYFSLTFVHYEYTQFRFNMLSTVYLKISMWLSYQLLKFKICK